MQNQTLVQVSTLTYYVNHKNYKKKSLLQREK